MQSKISLSLKPVSFSFSGVFLIEGSWFNYSLVPSSLFIEGDRGFSKSLGLFCLHFLLLSDRLRHLKAQSLSVCYLHDLWILLGKCFNVPSFPKVWSHLGLYSCITSGDFFFSFVCLGPSWFMTVVLAYLLITPWFHSIVPVLVWRINSLDT